MILANSRIGIEDLRDPERLRQIYGHTRAHYWTADWSPETYVALARAGFIATYAERFGTDGILLPEMQTAYAVLDWENLRVNRTMRRWMKSEACRKAGYVLAPGYDIGAILDGIEQAHWPTNWLHGKYAELMHELYENNGKYPDFGLMTTGLVTGAGELVAGELGYQVGAVYTSLTGFFDRANRRHNHAGKLQLHLLARHLQETGFAFWNLGHPYMQYKQDLGANVLQRQAFLERWPRFDPGSV